MNSTVWVYRLYTSNSKNQRTPTIIYMCRYIGLRQMLIYMRTHRRVYMCVCIYIYIYVYILYKYILYICSGIHGKWSLRLNKDVKWSGLSFIYGNCYRLNSWLFAHRLRMRGLIYTYTSFLERNYKRHYLRSPIRFQQFPSSLFPCFQRHFGVREEFDGAIV